MNKDKDFLEQFSVLSDNDLSSDEKEKMWEQIEQRGHRIGRTKGSLMSKVSGIAAAVAAVVIVAGGVGYGIHHGTNMPSSTSSSTSSGAQSDGALEPFVPPTKIQSVSIAGDSAASIWYSPTDENVVSKEIIGWLKNSVSTTVYLPKPDNKLEFGGYIGPAQLSIKTGDGSQVTIYPAYVITQGTSGKSFQVVYDKNVLFYKTNNTTQVIKSPELYAWLKNDQWKSEFTTRN